MISIFNLDPQTWQPHALHGDDRTYLETNCYTDVLIELVAAAGHDPLPMLGGAVEVDFEFDQFTFFKTAPVDLLWLYGMEVHETQPFRDLPTQIASRLAVGQTLIPELDAYWLPDTAATSYRNAHVKTSVVAEAIDLAGQRLRYFHNAGYYELSGEDYRGIFRLEGATPAQVLPPYVDLVRWSAPAAESAQGIALELFRGHLARRPTSNPFARFGAHLEAEFPRLLAGELADYHEYAFATVRMAGAAFELLGSYAQWQFGYQSEALAEIVGGTKMLSFRLARRREFDVAGAVAPMADAWERAIAELDKASR